MIFRNVETQPDELWPAYWKVKIHWKVYSYVENSISKKSGEEGKGGGWLENVPRY